MDRETVLQKSRESNKGAAGFLPPPLADTAKAPRRGRDMKSMQGNMKNCQKEGRAMIARLWVSGGHKFKRRWHRQRKSHQSKHDQSER